VRERLARLFAVGVGVVLVALAALFAERRNARAPEAAGDRGAPSASPVPPPAPADPEELARGRELFASEGCARCHSLAGVGSPRLPLDGVGGRLPPEEIRAFIVGDGAARSRLGPSVLRTKARCQELAADDLRALVALLSAER